MIVLDASVVLELLMRTPISTDLEARIFAEDQTLHAPHLLDLEVAQVLRRYCASGILTKERGQEAVRDLLDLPVTRYRHDIFLERIWSLRHGVTAYDAAYLALAEALAAPLITRDSRLASARGHFARVELV